MSERIEINVDFATQRAVQSIQELNHVQEQNIRATRSMIDSVEKADKELVEFAGDAGMTGKQLKILSEEEFNATRRLQEFGEKIKQTRLDEFSEKIKKNREEQTKLGETTNAVGNATKFLAGQVTGLISAYAGIGTAVQLWQEFNKQIREAQESQSKMLGGKLGFQGELVNFAQNMGFGNTPSGLGGASALIGSWNKLAPEVPANLLMKVGSAAPGFQLDPIKNPKHQQMTIMAARFAAAYGLDPELGGELFRIAAAEGADTPEKFMQVLGKLKAHQKLSPIENPSKFFNSYLRLSAEFIPQGLSQDDIGSLLVQSAYGHKDPRVMATHAEQTMRAIGGNDEEAQARLGERAMKYGLIDKRRLARDEAASRAAMEKDKKSSLDHDQQEISEEERRIQLAEDQFGIQQDRSGLAIDAARRRGKPRDQVELMQAEMQQRAEQHKERMLEMTNNIADRKRRMAEVREAIQKKARAKALAEQYRRLGPRAQWSFIQAETAGMSPDDQREFLTQVVGASAEEANAMSSALSPAARGAAAAVRKEGGNQEYVRQVQEEAEQLMFTPLGGQAIVENRKTLRENRVVTNVDAEIAFFKEDSAHRAEIYNNRWSKGDFDNDYGAKRGFSGTTRGRASLWMYRNDVLRRIYNFWLNMSVEERTAHPEIKRLVGVVANAVGISEDASYREIDNAHREFLKAAQAIANERASGKFNTRTPGRASALHVDPAGNVFEDNEHPGRAAPAIGPEGPSGFPTNERMDSATDEGPAELRLTPAVPLGPPAPDSSLPLPPGATSTGPISAAGGTVIQNFYSFNPGVMFTHGDIVRSLPGRFDRLF